MTPRRRITRCVALAALLLPAEVRAGDAGRLGTARPAKALDSQPQVVRFLPDGAGESGRRPNRPPRR